MISKGDLFCVKQNYKTLQHIEDSGEIHLSNGIRKIRIPSDKWDERLISTFQPMYLGVELASQHALSTQTD